MIQIKRFLLRLDPDLYQALEKWAADEFRSVNAQIEFLLRASAATQNRLPKGSKRLKANPKPEDPNKN